MTNRKKSKYTFVWGDYQPHMTVQTNINSLIKYSDFPWNRIKNIIQVSRNNVISCFHSKNDLENDKELGRSYFKESFAKKMILDMAKVLNKHRQMFREMRETYFLNLSNKELFDWLVRITDTWSLTISYFRITQADCVYYIVEEIKKHVSLKKAPLLMLPSELDPANLEQLDWQLIVKKPYSKKTFLEHAFKYPWTVMCHFTYKDVLETLKQRYEYDRAHLVEKDIRKEKRELKNTQGKILAKHPEIKSIVLLAQRLALSRMEVKSCWAGTDFYSIPLFEEIARRTKEDIYDLCKYYLIEEVKSLLLKGKKLSDSEKKARSKCFVGLWKDGKASYYSGEKAEVIAKKKLGDLYEIKSTNQLNGSIANPGRVIGTARILEANNLEQTRYIRRTFKKGEILITQMTQPSVVDIASRAAALITDEGGMLSHAAIISRELKIPCIVGTHFATKIIKDGDKIEVDANRGIVRILK